MGGLFDNAPKVAGINIVTGGGSKVTDPFGIFQKKEPPAAPGTPAAAVLTPVGAADPAAAAASVRRRALANLDPAAQGSGALTDGDGTHLGG